ncbi:MAG: cation:proton antiporter [Bacteroidota bacterium]|nr:cation:proton antiporter [Bacteroidota bacterium]MDX5431556.1 cation:proton antiporter [Bacteroidota bacterium]MDX5470277.1 cation:proton antiporter [Bacteroidota bacterium]
MVNDYLSIIIVCSLIILSYVFNLISKRTKIPSVLMLIGCGMSLKYGFEYFDVGWDVPMSFLQILGTVGLILIVLEGTFDLHLEKQKKRMIISALLVSVLLLLLSSFTITYLIQYFTDSDFRSAFLYGLSLSVISSAIVIPSVETLPLEKKEFMIYESVFSDIIGIMIFNLVAFSHPNEGISWYKPITEIGLTIIVSIVGAVLLFIFMDRITLKVKFLFLLAMITLFYSLGKLMHLSSLLLIFFFGLILNNSRLVFENKFGAWFKYNWENTHNVLREFKVITLEFSFVVRTLFFMVFGFSMNLALLGSEQIIIAGSIIVLIFILMRLINLSIFLKSRVFPEVLIAPRGLITITLFYSIPEEYKIANFDEGILFFTILATSVLMMIGLMAYRERKVTIQSRY